MWLSTIPEAILGILFQQAVPPDREGFPVEYVLESDILLLPSVIQAGHLDVDDVGAGLGPNHDLACQYLLVGFK